MIMRLFHRLDGITRQHSLINQLGRCQWRPVAEHDVEEFETVDMSSGNNETNRQRRRQYQADRTPQPGPERRGQDDRYRRQTGAMTKNQRF